MWGGGLSKHNAFTFNVIDEVSSLIDTAAAHPSGMCSFGDSYSVRSKKDYETNLLLILSKSQV